MFHSTYIGNQVGIYLCPLCNTGTIKTQMKLALLLKYPTFENVFSYFHEQNKHKIRFSGNCSVCTKKLINIKARKFLILALKSTF